jgi:heme-degrading monooxygenase HmoA
MILEVATLTIKSGQESAFEAAFRDASRYIAAAKGYASHELHRCIEQPGKYVLLVRWSTVEDHTVGFKGSADSQAYRSLVYPFYEAPSQAEHFEFVSGK